MDKASARGRLERAEDEFSDLTQGSKDLVDQDGTRYKFVDGSEATGVGDAADTAERIVGYTKRSMSS